MPLATKVRCSKNGPLFEHSVGAAGQRQGDSDPERLGGLEIDDHLDFCRLLDREVSRPFTFEHAASVTTGYFSRWSKVLLGRTGRQANDELMRFWAAPFLVGNHEHRS